MRVGLGREAPIATSVYRLADASVLMPVRSTERGPEPLFTRVSELPCAVAYTEADEAQSDSPEDYRIFSVQVVEALVSLPQGAGLVIDPRAERPILLGPQDRELMMQAAAPFPVGPRIRLGQPTEPPRELYDDFHAIGACHPEVRRILVAWYSVADAREKLLVTPETDGPGLDDPEWDALNRELVEAAAAREYPHPMQVVHLHRVPQPHRGWLESDAEQVYAR